MSLRSPSRRPTHPGALLREDILPALGMTQTEFADRLRVSRLSVSDLLHEKRALSPGMAVRLARLLNTTAESWLEMQTALSVWEANHDRNLTESIKPLPQATRIVRGVYTTDSLRPSRQRPQGDREITARPFSSTEASTYPKKKGARRRP